MFPDRHHAGLYLAEQLRDRIHDENVVVLALPRGGVPVAFEVAQALNAPLDVIVVRKLGVPFQPELGFGAIGEEGVKVINHDLVRLAHLTSADMAKVEEHERTELERRARRFRDGHPPTPLTGRTVIVVDDGIATGGTAQAACRIARARGASRVVLAIPVGAQDTIAKLRQDADEVVCLHVPANLYAIGEWYDDFTQTTDEQVIDLLQRVARPADDPGTTGRTP